MTRSICIRLPRYAFEANLHQLIRVLATADHADSVQIDFQAVHYYIPCAIVATIAKIKRWESLGKQWQFIHFQENPVSRYFQRMDFCLALGWELEEKFTRHHDSDDFVPIVPVPSLEQDVAGISTRLASCIDPDQGDLFGLVQFASSEVILNAKQHARAEGFVSGQYSPTKELARIGIADCGIGIRNSFQYNESPHFQLGMSEMDALLLALEPRISSTTHRPNMYGHSPNFGVGLSMLRQLAAQTLGFMSLISGDSWWYQENGKPPRCGILGGHSRFDGTICGVAFQRYQVENYPVMLKKARIELGLQSPDNLDNLFV